MSQAIRNWPMATRKGLWLTWLMVMLWIALSSIFDKSQEALLRAATSHDSLVLFSLAWIATGAGLWLLLGLSEGAGWLTSQLFGIAASVMGFVIGVPALLILAFVFDTIFSGIER